MEIVLKVWKYGLRYVKLKGLRLMDRLEKFYHEFSILKKAAFPNK